MNPFLNTFSAADGDDDIAGGLEDQTDGNAGLATFWIHVGGKVVGEDGGDDLVAHRAHVYVLASMVRDVCGIDGVSRIHQLCIEDRLVEVHRCVP